MVVSEVFRKDRQGKIMAKDIVHFYRNYVKDDLLLIIIESVAMQNTGFSWL